MSEEVTQPQVEDAILPDDFSMESPEPTESVEDTKPTEEVTSEQPTTEESPFLKVKYNKEEMALDEEKARELAQKGLNYDKVQERLQQLETDPRLSFVEELANQNGMTTEQFIEVFKQQQEQEKLNELIQQNIPEELAQEILENRKFRQQMEQERKSKEQEQEETKQFMDFLDFYKQANGKEFDANTDQLPIEVIEANQNGVPLKYAYMEHFNNQLRQQIQVQKQNEENQKKAPVHGVTEHGSTPTESTDPFLIGFDSI